MVSLPVYVWFLVLALVLCLPSIVLAGNACLQGIVGCTQRMRGKQDVMGLPAKNPCRAISEYTDCLATACRTLPVTCEVQQVTQRMVQVMESRGIQCGLSRQSLLKGSCSRVSGTPYIQVPFDTCVDCSLPTGPFPNLRHVTDANPGDPKLIRTMNNCLLLFA